MDLSELDGGGGTEESRRYGGGEGEGKEEMKYQVTLLSTGGSLVNGTTNMWGRLTYATIEAHSGHVRTEAGAP